MTNQANIYPKSGKNPTLANADSSRPNLGICFSGGGSRALTCAWGQMLGLTTIGRYGKARYISSVSGGTWACSVYSYLPPTISDDDLLGEYYPPAQLSLQDESGKFNVTHLSKYSYGQAPKGMQLDDLLVKVGLFLTFHEEKDHKWLWAYIIAKCVLEPFDLRDEGHESWTSSKNFTLSNRYAQANFPADAPTMDNFHFLRAERPFVIMNDNIMQKVEVTGADTHNIVQLPNQVTPVSGGAQGQTPDKALIGGGSVESYGYSSRLDQNTAEVSPVKVTIARPYSLIDIASSSSAFFADTLAKLFNDHISNDENKASMIDRIKAEMKPEHKAALEAQAAKGLFQFTKGDDLVERKLMDFAVSHLQGVAELIPTYNYWPIGEKSANAQWQYTDGGTLENTGILGMLAQTDDGSSEQVPIHLVAFDNTATLLSKTSAGKIIAGGQAASLFGIDFSEKDGSHQPYTANQMQTTNLAFKATSLIKVFDNSADANGTTPFEGLVKGLYATNCGAAAGQAPDDAKVNSAPAFHQMTLTTVDNALANISAGRKVNLLYIQNARINDWQDNIGDDQLKAAIVKGQEGGDDAFTAFKDFPNYSTAFKIGLLAEESNALSQMWAWAIADSASSLNAVLQHFIDAAS